MSAPIEKRREGSLEAPTRHPLDWKNPDFWSQESLDKELGRVFGICHGCRRCVSLCNSFPTLFDLVDESETMEIDGVARSDYWKVVQHCYLCDLCYMTKCPYVPPHEWNVDFPHLMLRAKAVHFRREGASLRDKVLSSPDKVGRLAGIPVVAETVNAANRNASMRKLLDRTLGVHPQAPVPPYQSRPLTRRLKGRTSPVSKAEATEQIRGQVALFATCYGTYNEPHLGEDLIAVFEHNGIPVKLAEDTRCCGMPKLELGDFDSIAVAKDANVATLVALVDQGWDIVAPIPSCVLMFKQELPLMFPDDPRVQKVHAAIYDPFEYLMLRHKAGKLAHRLPPIPGQDRLPRGLPPAGAEHRLEDPRPAQANTGHRGRDRRTLLRSQRHLRREERIPRHFHEDRSAGCQPDQAAGGESLFVGLPDGRPSD